MSYTCGANCFHTTSLQFGFMRVSKHHHDKTISLVAGQMTSVFCLHIDKVQRNSPNEVINFQHSAAFYIFLGCTLSKRALCLKDDLEFALTTTVNMACFVADFVSMLNLFTSVRDQTRLERSIFSTTPCFENLKCLKTLESTIGFESTLCITTFLATDPGNTTSGQEMV